jgi:hypothetical protein
MIDQPPNESVEANPENAEEAVESPASPKPRKRPRRLRAAPRPPLTESQILAWAEAHFARTGRWPRCTDRHVHDDRNEKWSNIDAALREGIRGLPGGSSLRRLLADRLGVRNLASLPDLTPEQILAWADAHFAKTGRWPGVDSGPVADAPGEAWRTLDGCLRDGRRGLPGGSSLAQLLAACRGARNVQGLPHYTEKHVIRWAKAHHRRTGRWPRVKDGPIADAPGETWLGVENALQEGLRGLPGGSSLAQLLAARLGVRNKSAAPPLTVEQILAWADAHYHRSGKQQRAELVSGLPQPRCVLSPQGVAHFGEPDWQIGLEDPAHPAKRLRVIPAGREHGARVEEADGRPGIRLGPLTPTPLPRGEEGWE